MLDTLAGLVRSGVICLLLCLVFAGCATTSGTMPGPEQLAAEGNSAPGTDVTALARGRALTVTECAGCHRLYWPSEYSPEEWPGIVRKMGPRASLTKEQMEDLRLYLVTASRAVRKVDGAGSD